MSRITRGRQLTGLVVRRRRRRRGGAERSGHTVWWVAGRAARGPAGQSPDRRRSAGHAGPLTAPPAPSLPPSQPSRSLDLPSELSLSLSLTHRQRCIRPSRPSRMLCAALHPLRSGGHCSPSVWRQSGPAGARVGRPNTLALGVVTAPLAASADGRPRQLRVAAADSQGGVRERLVPPTVAPAHLSVVLLQTNGAHVNSGTH